MNEKEINEDIKRLGLKIATLQFWLTEHPNHPDRPKIVGDLNHYRVKLETRKYNLENVKRGLPSHGEEMPPPTSENINKTTNTKI